ncbi:CaiB/BaiF CoA transferase family protein [Propylenella binzhouense]|nr:CoA transferase [Propylenella binzhouense]
MAGPLSGLKVLDLSRFIAGPHCAMILGDLGADVVKVEKTMTGEDSRLLAPFIQGESVYFMMFNRNKRSLTVDFRHNKAQELIRRLATEADVLIENFRPGTMDKMGCGWETLHELNPRLVMASLSGFGLGNRLTCEPCFDAIAQALSGIMDLTGEVDGRPMLAGTFLVDYATGMNAACGVLGALMHRMQSGEGQMVDVSLMGSASAMLMTAIPEYLVFGREMSRMGNRDRYVAPANTFETKDGHWVHIIGGSDAHFPRLARMIGQPELLQDPRFARLEARLQNVDAVEGVVAQWAKAHTVDEVMAAVSKAELPSAKVRTVGEALRDPYARDAGHIVDIEHPVAGVVPSPAPAQRLSRTPTAVHRPAPPLGHDTDEVLMTWLGMSAEEIEGLRAEAVI